MDTVKVRPVVRRIVWGAAALGLAAAAAGPAWRYVHAASTVVPGSIIGVLDAYNARTRVLIVATGTSRKSFLLPARIRPRRGSRVVHADQLPHFVGSRIKVRFTESSGLPTVESVMLSDDENSPAS